MGAVAHEIRDVTRLFQARHPGCELRFREIHASDPFGPLRSGDVDLAVVWLPIREPDLTVRPVLRTGRVVLIVGERHPLAFHESVCMEDLGDHVSGEPEPVGPVPDHWYDALVPRYPPSGRPIRRGFTCATLQEVLAVIANGEAVLPIQADATAYYRWSGVVYLPIRDAPSYEWARVWRTDAETDLIRAFARAGDDIGPMITPTSRDQ